MSYKKLIDNKRVKLSDTLRKILPQFNKISIATGYWDLPGTLELINELKSYSSIRLLIGQEPLPSYGQKRNILDVDNQDSLFPNYFISKDLEEEANTLEIHQLRNTVIELSRLIKSGVLHIKIMKEPRLHAKAFIFGDYGDREAIGIVGSSNFTKAGLTSNVELNSLEEDSHVVIFKPLNEDQENGHLSRFNEMWESENSKEWTGDFSDIIRNSPVGDLCFSPYDVYIKTLMEVFPDELIPPMELSKDSKDILYSFQNRNAGILINKLKKMKLAILADSVGLGKTITAGAVIKHYIDVFENGANILIIAPAALKQQWIDDLTIILGLDKRDFSIISEQDINAIRKEIEYYQNEKRKAKFLDLIVIDEAHNLRSKSGERHDAILDLFQQHQNADILFLTATPINNSLMDIVNQIELASKGRTTSVNVTYKRPDGSGSETLDFFVALNRIQTKMKQLEKNGGDIDSYLEEVKPTIHEGLRHYLVRSTRQGVEAEGGIVDKTGVKHSFPTSDVFSINYKYDDILSKSVHEKIRAHIFDTFEGNDPTTLNLDFMSNFTQQSSHPLDFLDKILSSKITCDALFGDKNFDESNKLVQASIINLVPNIIQSIFLLGFSVYRPEVYKHKYYGKTMSEISELQNDSKLNVQLSIHNILQVTWLKRMESSSAALLASVNNYSKRIDLFEKYLNKGFIVTLADAGLLESDYNDGEDIESAFADFDKYLAEREAILDAGKNPDELKKYGIERKEADPMVYNINQLTNDINRDRKVIKLLEEILNEVSMPQNDSKMASVCSYINKILKNGKYGKKVLVFSFFADTINYLKNNINIFMEKENPNFNKESEFLSGQVQNVETIVRKFSPMSKHYSFKNGEQEINFLFSTDILSEGQNLQDAGFLINYDLHWNPVRMIQRNGRINRLGSKYLNVNIANMRPTDELELYLKLVHRLENKIKTIRNTIGLDQGVLDVKDVNPIEFIEKYYVEGVLPSLEDDLLAYSDEHILELRKFLGKNIENKKEINRIKNIPVGKWNYVPSRSKFVHGTLALVKTEGHTLVTNNHFSDLFFIDVQDKGEYTATYIDSGKALDYLRTDENDNCTELDRISFDRLKMIRRAGAEAKRQAENPSSNYTLTNQYKKALLILTDSFPNNVDLMGTINKGTNYSNIKNELEKVLKKVNKEYNKQGTIYPATIAEFTSIFKKIQKSVSEEKEIESTLGVLYYASK